MTSFNISPCSIVHHIYPIIEQHKEIARHLYCMTEAVISVEILITAIVYRLCGIDYPPFDIITSNANLSDQDTEILNRAFYHGMQVLAPYIERYLPGNAKSLVAEVLVRHDVFGSNLVIGLVKP